MNRIRHHHIWIAVPLALFALSAANAEPRLLSGEPRDERMKPLLAKELPRAQRNFRADSNGSDWRQIRISKGAGLEVRHHFDLHERPMVLRVRGPVMKKRALGLRFELRF